MSRVVITRQDTNESIEIDVVQSAGLTLEWAVTSNPREARLPSTDSTTPLPTAMQITGVVSALDVDGSGLVGQQRFDRLRQWFAEGYAQLWTVTVPDKFGLRDTLVKSASLTADQDGRIQVSISVRYTAIVQAQTVARLYAVRTGSSSGRVPAGQLSAATEADLAEEQQDGTAPTSLLLSVGRFLGVSE